ncbi:SDR family NAD(P)-dependent oxidoreductase [Crateriforma conspicua]|uniref:Putative ketoacyl reductase n=1 Tax=Crateriforma conspicua TaxID=2527996 RepID=A0A5C5Y7I3_9PLAN|nr:SDR family NAD(P)-dependent oxidoreductase [Crateriforma conspicua]QDV65538.1 Putative ketoacyl reductase [Crateriforma conspicua]TWT70929.1 putative ketoacyl reductase [Crateriforma conspicua]
MTQPHDSHSLRFESPVALVTGGSAGLGTAIAQALLNRNYHVLIVGRDSERLRLTADRLTSEEDRTDSSAVRLHQYACDVTNLDEVAKLAEFVSDRFGRLDVLVNVVGQSDRGLASEITLKRIDELVRLNVHSTVICTKALLPLIRENRGSVVNIGSLASKIPARYLGGYCLAKHALCGWTDQLSLEMRQHNVHVGLVCPGPIARQDAGHRYDKLLADDLPPEAAAPGGGAKIKGLPPQKVADAVVDCIAKRKREVILPGKARLLIILRAIFPDWGDRILLRMTSGN